jgi:hypothetical protein
MDYLRMTAKDYRPAFIKDLTAIFDRIDRNNGVQSGGSAVRAHSPLRSQNDTSKKPPISASKKDNVMNMNSTQNLSATLPLSNSLVMSKTTSQKPLSDSSVVPTIAFTGDEPLAGAKFLAIYRQQRQEQ